MLSRKCIKIDMYSKKRKMILSLLYEEMNTAKPLLYLLPPPPKLLILDGNMFRQKHIRLEGFYEVWIDRYLETDFFKHFRMCPNTLDQLLLYVGPVYVKTFSEDQHGGIAPIEIKKALLMAIWYLAKGDTYISISNIFNVCVSSVCRVVHLIVECILQLLQKYISWPTEEDCKDIEKDFFQKAKYPGVIGAIDGCHVICKIPIVQHDSYQDRKFNHSITIQAISTSNMILTDISIGWPGSIHDARILKESKFGENIENNGYLQYFYDKKYHILGDSAYPLKIWMMTPYRDRGRLTLMQRKHNRALSSTRVAIENVFGLLKGRWRILQFVNVYSIERAIKIITACCILHNFCLFNKDCFTDFEPIKNVVRIVNTDIPANEDKLKRDNIAIMLSEM